jgi:hypothetical protein
MILYHYTPAYNLKSIQEQGLLPMSGLSWFTEDGDTVEATVNMQGRCTQARISVRADDIGNLKSFMEYRRIDRELLMEYCHVDLIFMVSDASVWHYSDHIVDSKNIIQYEILQEDSWLVVDPQIFNEQVANDIR